MPLTRSRSCSELFDRHFIAIRENLNVDVFVDHYRGSGALSDSDIEELTCPGIPNRRKLNVIVNSVKQQGKNGWDKFLSALESSKEEAGCTGHKDLLNVLRKSLNPEPNNEWSDKDDEDEDELPICMSALSLEDGEATTSRVFPNVSCSGCNSKITTKSSVTREYECVNPH